MLRISCFRLFLLHDLQYHFLAKYNWSACHFLWACDCFVLRNCRTIVLLNISGKIIVFSNSFNITRSTTLRDYSPGHRLKTWNWFLTGVVTEEGVLRSFKLTVGDTSKLPKWLFAPLLLMGSSSGYDKLVASWWYLIIDALSCLVFPLICLCKRSSICE